MCRPGCTFGNFLSRPRLADTKARARIEKGGSHGTGTLKPMKHTQAIWHSHYHYFIIHMHTPLFFNHPPCLLIENTPSRCHLFATSMDMVGCGSSVSQTSQVSEQAGTGFKHFDQAIGWTPRRNVVQRQAPLPPLPYRS